MKPLGVFLAATLAPAAIGSDLLEEAKGILQRLGNPGDYGRSLAEKGVREARTAAEGLLAEERARSAESQRQLAEEQADAYYSMACRCMGRFLEVGKGKVAEKERKE